MCGRKLSRSSYLKVGPKSRTRKKEEIGSVSSGVEAGKELGLWVIKSNGIGLLNHYVIDVYNLSWKLRQVKGKCIHKVYINMMYCVNKLTHFIHSVLSMYISVNIKYLTTCSTKGKKRRRSSM